MTLLDRLRSGVSTSSAAETQTLAADLAPLLPQDCALALHGDLGVGKTTFVQGLARGFGIVERVTSPTFTLFTLYRGAGRMLVHLDAYRIESPGEIDALMIEDFLVSPWCLAIEWPSKIAPWLPPNTWHFELGIDREETHSIWLRHVTPP